jgi:hypothetical protein
MLATPRAVPAAQAIDLLHGNVTMKQTFHLAGWHRAMNVSMKQTLHLAGWQRAMNVSMKQTLHLAGWQRAMNVRAMG